MLVLLKKICLFGPNQKKTVTMEEKRVSIPHYLYFAKKDPSTPFCSFMVTRCIRNKWRSRSSGTGARTPKLIESSSERISNLRISKKVGDIPDQGGIFSLPTNKIRRQWNPFSTIYCVSVAFPYYVHSVSPYMGIGNRAISMIEENMKNEKIEKQQETEGDRSP